MPPQIEHQKGNARSHALGIRDAILSFFRLFHFFDSLRVHVPIVSPARYGACVDPLPISGCLVLGVLDELFHMHGGAKTYLFMYLKLCLFSVFFGG